MFNRQSRYYRIPNQVTLDEQQRARESKGVRLLPEVSGKFFHTIESDDRLDQLAYKYYRKSKTWWHICDANPDSLSPLELLGDSVMVKGVLVVRWDDYLPPWNFLKTETRKILGVNSVILGAGVSERIETDITPLNIIGTSSTIFIDELRTATTTQVISAALDAELQSHGIVPSNNLRIRMLSTDTVWEIEDIDAQAIIQYRLASGPPAELNLYDTAISNQWSLAITFNSNLILVEEVISQIENLGFSVTDSELTGRVGKKIFIPPKYTG